MSNTKRVSVTVDLIDSFSKTLEKLDKKLSDIDKKIVNPKFEFGDNGQIDDVKKSLKSIEDQVNVNLDLHGKREIQKANADVERLSGIENVYLRVHDHELIATMAKMNALRRKSRIRKRVSAENEFMGNIDRALSRSRRAEGAFSATRNVPRSVSNAPQPAAFSRTQMARSNRNMSLAFLRSVDTVAHAKSFDAVGGITGFNLDDIGRRFGSDGGSRSRGDPDGINMKNMLIKHTGIGAKRGHTRDNEPFLKRANRTIMTRLIPRGQLSQDLVAFFMPFMFTAYAAVAGAVAVMGTTAAVGLSTLLLGLIGFGENAADSLHLAQVRLRLFGRELFKVMKPVSKTFAPWVDEWMQTIPHTIGRELSSPLQGMVVYRDTIEGAGLGTLRWVGQLIDQMNVLEPIISRLTFRLGGDIGDAFLRFFSWLVYELDDNYDVIQRVMGALRDLMIFVYRVSLLWSNVVASLAPVFRLLSGIANIINNDVIASIVGWTGASMILVGAVVKIITVFAALKAMIVGFAAGKLIAGLLGIAGAASVTAASLAALAKVKAFLLGLTGKGLLLVGAGIVAGAAATHALGSMGIDESPQAPVQSPVRSSQMRSGDTTINIYGNADNTQIQKMKDMFPSEYSAESHVQNSMSRSI